MSCIPSTPVVSSLLTTPANTLGWADVGTGLITSALSQYYPLIAGSVTMANLATTTSQHVILRQLEFEETATSSANIKKCPLLVLIYSGLAPTAPVSGQVYNASTTDLVGVVEIAAANYKRVSDTVWLATVNPDLYLRTTTSALASTLNYVILSNSATTVTFAASATGRLRAITEQGTAL